MTRSRLEGPGNIDATYGHLLPDSEDYLRGILDAYDGVYGLSADSAHAPEQKIPAQNLDADERT